MKKYSGAMSYSILTVAAMVILLTLSSCSKKDAAPEVKEWEVYQSAFYSGLELHYPKGWVNKSEANVLKIYSSDDAARKFFNPIDDNLPKGGIEVKFGFEKFSDVGISSLAAYKDTVKERLKSVNNELGGESQTTMGKENAEAIEYSAVITSKDKVFGKRLIAAHDSVFYYLNFEAFNKDYQMYKAIFDSIITSVKLPKPKQKYTDPNEASKPSKDVVLFENDFLALMHPDNFEASFPKEKKAGVLFTMKLQGLRQDCDITLDIFPANKNSLDKVFDDNKAKFNPKTTGDAKINDTPAKFITTSPASNIDRKVYFVVKNDKTYRIILTWYKPMTSDFLPAFENSVSSLKLK